MQPVSVASARLEARTHARRQAAATLIGMQGWVAFQDIDKFVLCGVGMAQGRDSARRELGQIDAEVGQSEQVAQRTLLAAFHLGGEGLRVVGGFDALGGLEGDKGDGW